MLSALDFSGELSPEDQEREPTAAAAKFNNPAQFLVSADFENSFAWTVKHKVTRYQ